MLDTGEKKMTYIRNTKSAQDHIIFALDVSTRQEAFDLVDELKGHISFYKVGYQLFLGEGMPLVRELLAEGNRVFLDLKMNDIETTVSRAVSVLVETGVDFFSIWGRSTVTQAAVNSRGSFMQTKLLSISSLTSSYNTYFREILNAIRVGCDGMIMVGYNVKYMRKYCPDSIIVTPGVRLAGTSANEHTIPITPRESIANGSDYLVIGRPIRDSRDKVGIVEQISQEIELGLSDKK
jgi:orotidine-5'-phosphate decarboxylase